jgi:hypothetical protein
MRDRKKTLLSKAPIFVVGTPRSGTTLTAKILGRHSEIFMPGETHFFDDIFAQRKELGNPSDPHVMDKIAEKLSTLYVRYNEPNDQARVDRTLFSDQTFIDALKSTCSSYEDVLSLFMESQLLSEGKTRWGNNAPRDIFNIHDILAFYPDAKIIICVRDIRDFLASYRDRWKVIPAEHAKRVKQIYHPILTSLLWKSSVRLLPTIRKLVPDENCLIVKYENLVTFPERTVKAICSFIDERFEPRMLAVETHNSSFSNSDSGIFSTSVNRWPDSLSKEEQAVAQFIGKKELHYLGYRLGAVLPNPFIMFKLLISFPLVFHRTMRVGKSYRGAAIPYLMRRVKSLF